VCGRFTLTSTPEELARRFGLDAPPELSPRYNIAPGQQVLAVRVEGEAGAGRRRACPLHWGLVPPWAETPQVGYRMINARAETLAERPAFREAFRARRCLVPADGFYEWADRGGVKQPYHIGVAGGGPLGFAGLWERWRGPDGSPLESCAIVTTDASPVIADIHPRMPVILDPADYAPWLDPALRDTDLLGSLLRPLPDAAIAFHPVGSRVNDASIDDPACALAVPEPPRQQSLF
jgi:putative SOS response-associated peptidase YedK